MSLFPNKLLLNILATGLILSSPMMGRDLVAAVAKEEKKLSPQVDKWTTFTSENKDFSVDLLKTPEFITQTIDVPKSDLKISYQTYISEPSDSVVYVISVWNYPKEIEMSKPEVNLQEGFKGMLSALPGSEVQSMEVTEFQGYKALEFLVKNGDIYFQGKLILVHNTLYQVFSVYKESEKMTDHYNHFINSFTLINPENKKLIQGNGVKMKL